MIEDIDKTEIDEIAIRAIRQILLILIRYIFCLHQAPQGNRKGVIINHRNIIDYIDWAVDACHIDEHTIMGNQSPFHFDISTQDIYSCFKNFGHAGDHSSLILCFLLKRWNLYGNIISIHLYWVPSAFINVSMKDALDKVDIVCKANYFRRRSNAG